MTTSIIKMTKAQALELAVAKGNALHANEVELAQLRADVARLKARETEIIRRAVAKIDALTAQLEALELRRRAEGASYAKKAKKAAARPTTTAFAARSAARKVVAVAMYQELGRCPTGAEVQARLAAKAA